MILDTNAISALFEGDAVLEAILNQGTKLSLPVIVLGEYRCGLINSRIRLITEKALNLLEQRSNILHVDSETVEPYATLCNFLNRAGKPIPTNDLWIAALAVQYSLPIVSRDRHFDHVPGVRRLTW